MNRRQRRQAKVPAAGRHPQTGERPHDMDATQLRVRLVQDALGGYATPVEWAFHAYLRIAQLDGISNDAAFWSVREEIASLGGVMPEAPGS